MGNRNFLFYKASWIFVIGFLTMASVSAWAHRPLVSNAELRKWGFKPQASEIDIFKTSGQTEIPYTLHSLPLPLRTLQAEDPIGGIMHQLQTYTKPDYYHGGIDFRTDLNQEIFSPVDGRIEAGYYAYADNPDGSTQKMFLSYADVLAGNGKPPWGTLYFEIAVIDNFGYRFEFHHIDADLLTKEVLDSILAKGSVKRGDLLGKTVRWIGTNNSLPYNHLHYNVLAPSGIYVNPLLISEDVKDTSPPQILFAYSVKPQKCKLGLYILDKIEEETSDFIVVETNDYIQGRYFGTPPTILKATFGKTVWEWNFTRALEDRNGLLPDIREVYLRNYCDTNGLSKLGSSNDRFFIKIPVPKFFNGKVLLEAFDMAGNRTAREVEVRTPSI